MANSCLSARLCDLQNSLGHAGLLRGCTPVRLRLAESPGAAGCARLAVLKLEFTEQYKDTDKSQTTEPHALWVKSRKKGSALALLKFQCSKHTPALSRARAHTHTHAYTPDRLFPLPATLHQCPSPSPDS